MIWDVKRHFHLIGRLFDSMAKNTILGANTPLSDIETEKATKRALKDKTEPTCMICYVNHLQHGVRK